MVATLSVVVAVAVGVPEVAVVAEVLRVSVPAEMDRAGRAVVARKQTVAGSFHNCHSSVALGVPAASLDCN